MIGETRATPAADALVALLTQHAESEPVSPPLPQPAAAAAPAPHPSLWRPKPARAGTGPPPGPPLPWGLPCYHACTHGAGHRSAPPF